jgi:NAD(P)-dependent dehydrogenase (short-subunit alcohol dehydrogenase family)
MAAAKTAVVTGSTDGLGRMVATRLATEHGYRVIVHGRDRARGQAVAETIARAGGEATFIAADFAALAEVRKFAADVDAACPRIDLLINNAGIGGGGTTGKRQESRDGHELRFAVNYLAGFLLTRLLLGKIKANPPARIINVSSLGQQEIEFDDVMLTRGYSGTRAYCQSKLAQILFTFDLAEELKGSGVTANCLHPATYMDTTMVRQSGVNPWSTVEQGADAVMNLALTPQFASESGPFFDELRRARPNAQAFDEKAREQLRTLSRTVTGSG